MSRGDIVLVNLPASGGTPTNVQLGLRPAVIVQADSLSSPPSVVLVVPTTTNQRAMRFSCSLLVQPDNANGLTAASVLLTTQLRAIDRKLIVRTIGRLNPGDLKTLDENLKMLLNL